MYKIYTLVIFLTAVLTGVFQVQTAAASKAENLVLLPLDAVEQVGLSVTADTEENAIKITTKWPTNINITQIQPSKDLGNKTIWFTAEVKCSGLAGSAYLEMWAHLGDSQYFSRGLQSTISGDTDWQTIKTPFMFKKGEGPDQLTLNLVIEGSGTVWIRNAELK